MSGHSSEEGKDQTETSDRDEAKGDGKEFGSKAQVMTLMTTDVDRVSEFSWHIFTIVGS